MCGIFGFFSGSRKINKDEINLSIESIRHRGPDNAGVVLFKGNSNGYYPPDQLPDGEWSSVLAHTRLSIIDLTEAASQPMCNEDNSVWIVYNGEIYNFKEIREELKARGHIFKSRSDTEVILHGYEEWGSDIVAKLRGMFAFALLDKRNKKLILSRDRLGVKPLKYFFDGNTFIFASELKGFMHLIPGKLDLNALNKFFTLKYISSPDTVFEGIKKVSPGEMMELDIKTGRLTSKTFWKPEFYPKSSFSFSEAQEKFKRLFSESVYMRTISDVPIGVYLSGGMDSSAIVAFLKDNGIDDINTFTIKFNKRGYDESEYAKVVSNHFQTTHHEFQIPELSFDGIQNVINSLDEPFGDPSYIPTYFLSKYSSEFVKVILSGDGGDEILGGYKRYYIHARGKFLDFLPRIQANFIKNLQPEINKKIFVGKMQKIAEELSLGFWDAYLLRFSGFSNSFKRFVLVPELYKSLNSLYIDNLISNFSESSEIKNTMERLIWIDLHTYLPDYILTKTDLALMAHSVEGRNPFVDYKLVEFSNMLAPEYKFKENGKYILKTILAGYLPEGIINRKKMGFSPPIKYWFKENTHLLYDIFSKKDFVSHDIFDLKRIHQIIDKIKTTDIDISEQLWLIMVLELWRRTYKA